MSYKRSPHSTGHYHPAGKARMSTENISVIISANIASLLSGFKSAAAAVAESTGEMKENLHELSESAHGAQSAFYEFFFLREIVELFSEMLSGTAELAEELTVLSNKTGIAVDALSAMQYAAELSQVSSADLSTGMQRLAKNMEEAAKGTGAAADAMKRMGLSVTDSSGALIPMQEQLLQLAGKFSTMQDGLGKTALAMDLFGRSGANLIPFLNKGREGIAELEDEARRLGVVFSVEGVNSAMEYEDATRKLHAEMDAAQRDIALGLMPTLTALANSMTEAGVAAGTFTSAGHILADVLKALVTTAIPFVAYFAIVRDMLFPPAGAGGRWQLLKDDIQAAVQSIKDLWADPEAKEALKPGTMTPPPAPPGKDDALKRFETQWLKIKDGQRENFGDLAILEANFWRQKLLEVEKGSNDELAIRKRLSSLDDQITKATYDGQLAAIRARESVDADDKAKVLEDRRVELALIRQHYGDMSKEVQDGIKRVNDAQRALTDETKKNWVDTFNAIPKAFESAIQATAQMGGGFRDLMRNLAWDIAGDSIAAGLHALAEHEAQELAKREITVESVVQRVALETWAAIQSVAVNAWAAIAAIANYAAVGAAAAWAAVSAIPFVGPFLAPGMAFAALAGILALSGKIHSAAGGFDIPKGLNPVTQLHAEEMVLPKPYADVIRGMAGTGGGGSGGSGGGDTYHVTIQAMDARSVAQFMSDNYQAVSMAVKKGVKYGELGAKNV